MGLLSAIGEIGEVVAIVLAGVGAVMSFFIRSHS